MTEDTPLFSRTLQVSELPPHVGRTLKAEATAEERAAITAAFDLHDLASLSLTCEIIAAEAGLWRLKGVVKAKARQSCVVTLAPIKATIEEPLDRLFIETPAGAELEIDIDPEGDDPPDPLGDALDYGAAALEAFALALDPYPRAPGATIGEISAAPPGAENLTEADLKPFAGLAALKKAMEDGD